MPATYWPAADAWVFMAIASRDHSECMDIIRAGTGDELDELLESDTRFVFVVCNDACTRLAALRDEAAALQMLLHFVDAYANAKCVFGIVLAVQQEFELQLRCAGAARFLEVSEMGGAA
jgi:hypothetical protein